MTFQRTRRGPCTVFQALRRVRHVKSFFDPFFDRRSRHDIRICKVLNKRQQTGHPRQIRELKAAGAEEVVFEYEHGDARIKKELQMLLDTAREGDSIITLEVSRLSRSTQQLCEIVEVIKRKHLRLVIVGSITVDCRSGEIDPMSQAFIQMSAVFAELELSIIRARVKSGMANARAKGRRIGRPRSTKEDIPGIFLKHYPAYKAGKMNVSELARVCGLSRPTVYKYLRMV